MKRHGLQDILVVNLTSGAIERMPVTRQMALDFIGGQGIGSYLLMTYVKPGIDPLGPENALILSPGLLAGTSVPSASRTTFLAKSPTLGAYLGMSNGGNLTQLRYTGYDHLVVLGRSPYPVYLKITDGEAKVCDARHLWGKDTFDTAEALWSELGPHYDVAAIGPAGENLVRHAAIIGNKHVAWGRTGMGAVMGAKKLKAIAVSGSHPVEVAHPTKLLKLSKELTADIMGQTEAIEAWRTGGTWKMSTNSQPVRNPASDLWDPTKYSEKLEHHPHACPGCPVGCKATLKVRPGYKYQGLEFTVGCTFSTMNGPFGLGLGLTLLEDMMKCGEAIQRLGMDSEVSGGIISLLTELFQVGIATGEHTGGLELHWGDADTALRLLHMMGRREGIGDMLAEGTEHIARAIGGGAEHYLVNNKGVTKALTAHSAGDLRKGLTVRGLGWTLNYRGHCDRHRFPANGDRLDQPRSDVDTLFEDADHFGIPREALSHRSRERDEFIPWVLRYVQDFSTVAYALGFCDRGVIMSALPIDRMTEIYNLATGLDVTRHDLLAAGRRIWNMEKVWVTMQGQTRAADYPPERYFTEEMRFRGKNDGQETVYPPASRGWYEGVLNRYYESEGWDPRTGLPSLETLRQVGLDWLTGDYKSFLAGQRIGR